MNKKKLLKHLIRKIILSSYAQETNAVVTSVNEKGIPKSRMLFTYFEKNNIFLLTRSESSIVKDIKQNCNLSLNYYSIISPVKYREINITPEYKNTELQMEHLQINLIGKAKLENLNKNDLFDTKINFEPTNIEISTLANLPDGSVRCFIEYNSYTDKITKRRLKYGCNRTRNIAEIIDKQNSYVSTKYSSLDYI